MKRRDFLNAVLLGTGMPLVGLNRQVIASVDSQLGDTGGSRASTHRRIVLVELAGANDGLNTLVPFTNDHYHRLRPTIGLTAEQVVALDDSLGMHKALQPLMPLWERGELAWIQGLGYPQPSRSHFKSIALWENAGDGTASPDSEGWMTHAIEHQLARAGNDPHGISLSGSMSLFASETGRWLTARSVNELLQKTPTVQSVKTSTHATLGMLQRRLHTLDSTLNSIAVKLEAQTSRQELPAFDGGGFGEQLRQVATLIAAGLDTPVYRVQLKGFDTHDKQPARHRKLLNTLAQGLVGFSAAMRDMNEWNNTLVMSYSEFGRRAQENRSSGTDHGAAAPHLLMGGSVAGGLYGAAPDLADLLDGDPQFTMDYRALYHSTLVDGLGAESESNKLITYRDSRLRGLFNRV